VRTLNLGILAHVDAGKTSLTERLLHAAGVIDEIGSVDDGNTQTDSLALERRRGITIKSAVVSFTVGDVTVNLIDTPGHPDFIAEVERVLSVLDGAVLVISAVEGVQAQTRVLMRTLQRLRIPTLLFVNKIDRGGASAEGTLAAIAAKLTAAIVPMSVTGDLGTADAWARPSGPSGDGLLEVLAEHDEGLLAAYVADERAVSADRLREALARQSRQGLVHPVFFGSAITGAGVGDLIAAIPRLLPALSGDPAAPLSGSVFKVERGPAGEKIAYTRIFGGTLRVRDRLVVRGQDAKVTAIRVFDAGGTDPRPEAAAGRIAKVWGLSDVRIGDPIGVRRDAAGRYFAPPTLETVVVPAVATDRIAMYAALSQLAEQDPLINLRQDDVRQELYLSLYGEVQKEVIQATLADEYGVDVAFRETTMICVERPTGVGEAVEFIYKNPFLATVGLRVEPGPAGSGVTFRLDVPVEAMPLFVFKAVEVFRDALEETIRETLRQGLGGWQVTDCLVTLTHCDYNSPGTSPGDFRKLVPLVLMDALRRAGTVVCEPIHRLHIEGPADTLSPALRLLAKYGAVPHPPVLHPATYELDGDVPAAHVHALQQRLPALTRGEGILESTFDHYRPVRGPVPKRSRTDHNPLNRKEYLLHVVRRL